MRTLKPALVACIALLVTAPAALAQPAAGGGATKATLHTQPVRFGGFGGRGFGRPSSGFGRGRYGYRSRGRGTGIFRRIVRALAIAYLLHLLFTTPGGLIVLLLMIVGFALLMSRFRRRRALRYY